MTNLKIVYRVCCYFSFLFVGDASAALAGLELKRSTHLCLPDHLGTDIKGVCRHVCLHFSIDQKHFKSISAVFRVKSENPVSSYVFLTMILLRIASEALLRQF